MSLWKPASIEVEPETILAQWRVFKVHATENHPESIHFVGRVISRGRSDGGRVCSAVQEFDKSTMRGKTQSGRIYELHGPSGVNGDAMYVWGRWSAAYATNGATDVTEEYEPTGAET